MADAKGFIRCENLNAGNSCRKAIMASILSLANVLGEEMTYIITWFQTRGQLAQNKSCPACNHSMDMQTRSDIRVKR